MRPVLFLPNKLCVYMRFEEEGQQYQTEAERSCGGKHNNVTIEVSNSQFPEPIQQTVLQVLAALILQETQALQSWKKLNILLSQFKKTNHTCTGFLALLQKKYDKVFQENEEFAAVTNGLR